MITGSTFWLSVLGQVVHNFSPPLKLWPYGGIQVLIELLLLLHMQTKL